MYTRKHRANARMAGLFVLLGLSGLNGGCLERDLKPLNPCLVSGVAETVAVDGVDKVDIMFAVDNSKSMEDEQEKLRVQFPKLVQTLVSGVREDQSTFPAAKDLHLGVITTNMGVPGLTLPTQFQCEGYGDDGRLISQSASSSDECSTPERMSLGNARFITYKAEDNALAPEEVAARFGCIAQVGAEGCGYEMQLEAVLKGLWPYPEYDIDPSTGDPYPEARVTFLTDNNSESNARRYGNGGSAPQVIENTEISYNGGFLRNDTSAGLSLVAIVLVTDEEDCSSTTVNHLQQAETYPAGYEYLADQPPNTRCFFHKDREVAPGQPFLHNTERYVKYLKLLREGNEQLVIFAAIAGVPPQLTTADMQSYTDDESREAYYEQLLSDSRMQERLNSNGTNLDLACLTDEDNPDGGGAYPARRIVEVVRGFEDNGVIQSICQESFAPAIDAIIEVIATQLGAVCLPRKLVRQADGTVACRVVWELPADPSAASSDAPTDCDDRDFLSTPTSSALRTESGGLRCEVTQLPVLDQKKPTTGEGWYYDDFSDEVKDQCRGADNQRVAFSDDAVPPNGVTVQLECLNETQKVQSRDDINFEAYLELDTTAPAIGSQCDGDDTACELILSDGEVNRDMFCHRENNVCVLKCISDADCPPAWVCDDRPEQTKLAGGSDLGEQSICVNPTCGTTGE